MKKILFTSYSGLPTLNSGGGNKIIALLIKRLNYNIFDAYYFSDFLKSFNKLDFDSVFDRDFSIGSKKQLGQVLFKKNPFYQRFVLSKHYQMFYVNNIKKKFFKISKISNSFNVIHSHDSLSANIFHLNKNSKKILSIHSKGSFYSDLFQKFFEQEKKTDRLKNLLRIEKEIFNKADLITFPSNSAKNFFYEDLNMNNSVQKEIKIIHNGIDLNYINNVSVDNFYWPININPNDFELILANVANHSKLKNIDIVLKVVNYLKEKLRVNVLLINIGTGYLTNELKLLAKKLNLDSNVLFLGNLHNELVLKFLKKSDVFISLAEKVIFDLVILEAIGCGIPVVAKNDGGNKEIIEDGKNGYLVETNDIELISQAILNCAGNKEIKKNLKLESKFYLENMVSEYQKLYE